jgi:hypothetical protein
MAAGSFQWRQKTENFGNAKRICLSKHGVSQRRIVRSVAKFNGYLLKDCLKTA